MANEASKTLSQQVQSDLAAVIDHLVSGKPLDEELRRRVTERADKARDELVRKYGVREIAVDLIRESRGGRMKFALDANVA